MRFGAVIFELKQQIYNQNESSSRRTRHEIRDEMQYVIHGREHHCFSMKQPIADYLDELMRTIALKLYRNI
ncbi:MAG: hypothetical protein DMG88_20975 [Acidobacteria bacterium]|nr:MAG: hypothetical protein DMG88_20975 [Acidobacteriota bacterium]